VRRMRAGLVGNLRHRVRYRCSLLHILGRLPLLLALAHNVGDQLALTCLGFERPALLTRDEAALRDQYRLTTFAAGWDWQGRLN
jgi:hypothetical protein